MMFLRVETMDHSIIVTMGFDSKRCGGVSVCVLYAHTHAHTRTHTHTYIYIYILFGPVKPELGVFRRWEGIEEG